MQRIGSLGVCLLAALLVVSVAGIPGAAALQESGSEEACSEVRHTAFMESNSTIAEVNDTGSATASEANVPVTVEETDSFVRLRSRNPNGYCVSVSVEISEAVVTPAELGTVDAQNSSVSAEWRAMHSLERDKLYTEVQFELPPGSEEVLFAPSKLRVQTLSWTGDAERGANSTIDALKDRAGLTPELEQNEYYLERNESGAITTVSLKSSDGRHVEEWHALYRTSEGDKWRPVGQESSKPVYYAEDDDTVQFHYNEPAEVKFVANPGVRDRLGYDATSYIRSFEDIASIELPLTVSPGRIGALTISEPGVGSP